MPVAYFSCLVKRRKCYIYREIFIKMCFSGCMRTDLLQYTLSHCLLLVHSKHLNRYSHSICAIKAATTTNGVIYFANESRTHTVFMRCKGTDLKNQFTFDCVTHTHRIATGFYPIKSFEFTTVRLAVRIVLFLNVLIVLLCSEEKKPPKTRQLFQFCFASIPVTNR